MKAIESGLERVRERASEAEDRVFTLQEGWTGDFSKDMTDPQPNRRTSDMLKKIREGAVLISKAISPDGLKLPNGEVFRVQLEDLDGPGGLTDKVRGEVRPEDFNI